MNICALTANTAKRVTAHESDIAQAQRANRAQELLLEEALLIGLQEHNALVEVVGREAVERDLALDGRAAHGTRAKAGRALAARAHVTAWLE